MKPFDRLIDATFDGNVWAQTLSYIVIPILFVTIGLFIVHVTGIADTPKESCCKYHYAKPK